MLLVMLLTATTAWAWSGSGTAADPYQISTLQEWKNFASLVDNENADYGDKCYKLTADITVTGTWSSTARRYGSFVHSITKHITGCSPFGIRT